MKLLGRFTNKSNKVEITLNSDMTFLINGFKGINLISGNYWFEDSRIAGFPYYLVLKRNDILSFGVDRALINILDDNAFQVLDDQFSEINDSHNIEVAVFTKVA